MKHKSIKAGFIVGFLLILGILLRLSSWYSTQIEGELIYKTPDSIYHLRRVMLALFSPNHLSSLDYFRGLDTTLPCIWPIQYDFFVGLWAWLLSFGQLTPTQAPWIIGFFPIFLSVLAGLLVYFIAKEREPNLGFLALFIYVASPKNIDISGFTMLDHHIAEMCAFVLTLWGIKKAQISKSPTVVLTIVSGSMALFLVWPGSTLYLGVLFFILGLWSLKHPSQTHQIMSKAWIISGVLLGFIYPYQGTWNLMLRFDAPSLFQPLALIFCGIGLWSLNRSLSEKTPHIPSLILTCLLALPLLFPIVQGLMFIGGGGEHYQFTFQIAEFQPLLKSFDFSLLMESASPLILVALIGGFFLLIQGFKHEDFLSWLVSSSFLIFALLTLQSQRYLYMVTLMLPLVITELIYFSKKRPQYRQSLLYVLSVFAVLGSTSSYVYKAQKHTPVIQPELVKLSQWLQTQTPIPGRFDAPSTLPSYGILAPWDIGHFLLYYSQRPVLSDNFGLNAFAHPQLLAASSTQDKAIQPRYLLLNSTPAFQTPSWLKSGDNAPSKPEWFQWSQIPYQEQSLTISKLSPTFMQSVFFQLYFKDAPSSLAPYRLAYESHQQVPIHLFYSQNGPFLLYGNQYPPQAQPIVSQPSKYKLYEKVPGALLKGTFKPLQKVTLSNTVFTNSGRQFVYQQALQADTQGRLQVRVFYGSQSHFPHTQSPYLLQTEQKQYLIPVSDQAVKNGEQIALPGI